VDSCIKFFIGHIMTHPAVDLFQLFCVRELIDRCILMAIDTLHKLVDRTAVTLEIHIKRDCAPASLCGQFPVGVTGFAILIALREGKTGQKDKAEESDQEYLFINHSKN
jgi:hypothetical protein